MASSQQASLNPDRLGRRDWTNFWREPALQDLECLHARFQNHVYAPHRHESYVIGTIEAGTEIFEADRRRYAAVAGEIAFVNPEVLHDGSPGPEGYSYRMLYPSVALIGELAEEIFERPGGPPEFPRVIVRDPLVSLRLSALHSLLERRGDPVVRDQMLLETLALILRRHANAEPRLPRQGEAPRSVAAARMLIEEALEAPLSLDDIAAAAGLSRFQLIRAFRRHLGQTPGVYLLERRVERARRLLKGGTATAEAAAACGFFDQSHLTRAFKARVGVTPGVYRQEML